MNMKLADEFLNESKKMLTAQSYQQNGELEKALEIYENILDGEPNHPPSLMSIGLIYLGKKQLPEAEEYLKKGVSNFETMINSNYFNELEDALGENININQIKEGFILGLSASLGALGFCLYHQKKYAESEVYLKKSLDINSNNLTTNQILGITLFKLNKFYDAEIYLKKAIQIDQNDWEANFYLGNTFLSQKRNDEAEVLLRKAVQLKPDFIYNHISLGLCLTLLDKYDEAEVYLRKAVQLEPDNSNMVLLGNNLSLQLKFDESEVYLRKAVQLKPDDLTTVTSFVSCLLSQKKLIEADHYLRDFVHKNPNIWQVNRLLGLCLHYQGLHKEGEFFINYANELLVKTGKNPEEEISKLQQYLIEGDYIEKGATKSVFDNIVAVRSNIASTETVTEQFKICPYCGKELNMPKTPKFCPYCAEQLSIN